MPDPFKLTVLKALTAALKEITPADGYTHDLSDIAATDGGPDRPRVFRGRAWFGDDDPIPMLSILEGVDPAEWVEEPPVNTVSSEYDWPVMIQGFVNDDPDNPTDPAYALLADVRRRLAVERKRRVGDDLDPLGLGRGTKNRIIQLKFGAGVCRPADDVSAKAWFWLSVTLRIIDNAAEPDA